MRHLSHNRRDARFAYRSLHGFVPPWRRAVATHPTGIRALVSIVDTLVIARGDEGRYRNPVGEAEDRQLLTREAVLDQYVVPCVAEFAVQHHLRQRRLGLIEALCNNDAFARCEPIRLDDDRRTMFEDV